MLLFVRSYYRRYHATCIYFIDEDVANELFEIKTTGYAHVGDVFVEEQIAAAVADIFNARTGEELKLHKHVLPYTPIITHSMPVDLAVVVVAWYTYQRAPHFDAIETALKDQLKLWWPDLKTECHLNVIGAS